MGARLGRYELLFPIARGGMAEVHAARMHGEGGFTRIVAVKRMLPHLAEDEVFVQMLLDEARIAGAIASPHVVATLDCGRDDSRVPYLAMELVRGVSLAELLRALNTAGRQIPLDVASAILVAACEGLADAHEACDASGKPLGVVHRDVSPQNVLVDLRGQVRVSDFGIAFALTKYTETRTGELKGKVAYFSPEQARGESVDARSDVFALGIVAWELIARARLFSDPEGTLGILEKVRTMPIPALATRREIPAALDAAVMRALERDLRRRTPSARAMAAELRSALEPASSARVAALVKELCGARVDELEQRTAAMSAALAATDPVQPRTDTVGPPVEQPPTTPARIARPRRRTWPAWIAMGVVAAGIAIGVGWIAVSRAPDAVSGAPDTPSTRPISTPAIETETLPSAEVEVGHVPTPAGETATPPPLPPIEVVPTAPGPHHPHAPIAADPPTPPADQGASRFPRWGEGNATH